MFQIKTLDKHSAFCFFSKVLKTSRFFDTIYMYNYVKRGLGNENEKGDNADKQAQHNYARFYTGGVRLFVLPDKQYKFFSHRIYRLVNQKSRR